MATMRPGDLERTGDVSPDRARYRLLGRTLWVLLAVVLFDLVLWFAWRIELYHSLGVGWQLWLAILLGWLVTMAIASSIVLLVVRRGQFTLRQLLIGILAFTVVCVAWRSFNDKGRQRQIAKYLLEHGAHIELVDGPEATTMERVLGHDWFYGVAAVTDLNAAKVDTSLLMELPELEILRLSEVSDDQMAPLSQLAALRSLHLSADGSPPVPARFTGSGLEHLARHPALEDLTLSSPDLDEASLAHLGDIPHLKTLTVFAPLTDRGLRLLAECKGLQSLQLNQVTARGLDPLCELPRLEILSIHQFADLGNGLAGLQHAPQLKQLYVSSAALADEDFVRVAQCPLLTQLTVRVPSFSEAALTNLSSSKSIRSLTLQGAVADEALAPLARLDDLSELWIVTPPNAPPIGDAALEQLSKIEGLSLLNFDATVITEEGLKWIESMPHLEHFWFSSPHISPKRHGQLTQQLEVRSRGDEGASSPITSIRGLD